MAQAHAQSAVQRRSSKAGRLEIADGWARWQASSGDGDWHRRVAAQVVWGSTDSLRSSARPAPCARRPLLIEPLAKHRVMAGHRVTLAFIEPWALRAGATLPATISRSDLVHGCLVVSELGAFSLAAKPGREIVSVAVSDDTVQLLGSANPKEDDARRAEKAETLEQVLVVLAVVGPVRLEQQQAVELFTDTCVDEGEVLHLLARDAPVGIEIQRHGPIGTGQACVKFGRPMPALELHRRVLCCGWLARRGTRTGALSWLREADAHGVGFSRAKSWLAGCCAAGQKRAVSAGQKL